jgi:ATP-dependent RNA helicase DeaD
MLNMGFVDDIEKVLKYANDEKSMMLFSATMPKEIIRVAKKYMDDYEIVSVKTKQMTTSQTKQYYFSINNRDKLEALCRIMDIEKDFFGIVFCKTKKDVDDVAAKLTFK